MHSKHSFYAFLFLLCLIQTTMSGCNNARTFGSALDPQPLPSPIVTDEPKIVVCLDQDGDGFGDETQCISADESSIPDGYSKTSGDCDDSNETVFPGATETENNDGIDQNCDGLDGIVRNCTKSNPFKLYRDSDGDGYGRSNETISFQFSCGQTEMIPEGFSFYGNDCDDTNPDVFPGAGGKFDCETESTN